FVRELFEWVDSFETSVLLRESTYGYAFLLSAHVVTMCMFAGLVVMMDLRLAGIGNLRTPISQIQKRLFPWQAVFMVLSTITGGLLVYSQPMRYYGKVFFWTKFVMIVLAGINALAFHLTTYRSVATWDRDVVPPFKARVA